MRIFLKQAAEGRRQTWKAAVDVARPYFEKISPDEFLNILSTKLPNGDTLLHAKERLDAFLPLIEQLPSNMRQQAMALQNAEGLSVTDLLTFKLSLAWLKSPKLSTALAASLSSEDYVQRVGQLRTKVQVLWSGLRFGDAEGEVDPKLLEVNGKPYTSAQIAGFLNDMVEKMVQQEAWLGTPPANDQAALHRFYSTMLINFEQIVAGLEKRQKPHETAGFLTSIAAVRIEERCAAAYRAEIEQKRDFLADDLNLESLVIKAASNALQAIIEKIVRREHASDSHEMNQFNYAAGLTSAPDLLSRTAEDSAQAQIMQNWSFADFYRDFGHGVPNEYAIEWLKARTPPDFGPEYRQVEQQFKEDELHLLQATVVQLEGAFPPDQAAKMTKLVGQFRAPPIAAEELHTAGKEEMLKNVLQKALNQCKGMISADAPLPDLDQVYHDLEKAAGAEGRKELVLGLVQRVKSNLSRANMPAYMRNLQILNNMTAALPNSVEKILLFHTTLEKAGIAASHWLQFLQIKQAYDRQIEQLAQKLEDNSLSIAYDPSTHSLPSQACDYARRLKYNEDMMASRSKMLLHILQKLGVI